MAMTSPFFFSFSSADITKVHNYFIFSFEKESLPDATLKLEATAKELAFFERDVTITSKSEIRGAQECKKG